jgi:hypothetical protein
MMHAAILLMLASGPANAKPALDELRAIGKRVARGISEKNYAGLYPLLCAADKAKSKPEGFANMLREVHKASGTKSAELASDDEIVYENRRAGAKSAADLDKLQTVLVPIRLHFAPLGGGPGDSTSVQDWVFRREGGAWCTPLDD